MQFICIWLAFQAWQASAAVTGQGITAPFGVGAASGFFKPDIQMPIPEQVKPTITMQPMVTYQPALELHTTGFCVPRQAWQLQAAYAADCPANTYMQTYFNGQQVCAATRCTGPFGANKPAASLPQMKNTLLDNFAAEAVASTPATYWGGDAGTVCTTILLKPIMSCGEGCLVDNR